MGELYSILTAMVWAVAVILLKRSGESLSPFTLNLFRVVTSTVLLAATMLAVGMPFWGHATSTDCLILFASGIIAIAISDTLFHTSLNLVGAGISAIIDCFYSPFTVVIAFIILNEKLTPLQLGGMLLVVGGVATAAWPGRSTALKPHRLLLGVVLGTLSMLGLAFGIVIAKPVLVHTPVLWATFIRQVGCLLVMLPVALVSPKRRKIMAAFRPNRDWRVALPGAVLGSYFSSILWIAGMKYTQTGVAAILSQSNTIYILILAAVFLKEPLTRRKIAACTVAAAGIAMVTFG